MSMKEVHFRNAVVALIIIGVLVMIVRFFENGITDPDTWWHLAAGQYMVENRTIPHHDIFSWTLAGKPWVTHEWLPEVLFYLAHGAGQFWGVLALVLFFVVLLLIFYWRLLSLAQGSFFIGVLTLLLVGELLYPFLQIRPQVFSYLFFVIFLYVLYLFLQEKKDYLWVLPVLMVLWANSHGSFLLGPALVFLFMLCALPAVKGDKLATYGLDSTSLKKLALVFVLCVAAITINPNGIKLLVYPLETVGDGLMMSNIQEWSSPDFHNLYNQMFLAYFMATLLVFAISPRKIQSIDLLLFLAFSIVAFVHGRFIAYALLVFGLLWPRYFNSSLYFPPIFPWLKIAVIPLVLVLYAFTLITKSPPQTPIDYQFTDDNKYPVAALEYLEDNPLTGTMFNQYGWGGYLIWNRAEEKVFIDGRADVYIEQVFGDYLTISSLKPDVASLLEAYRIDYVFMPTDSALVQGLKMSPDWFVFYEDDTATIVMRNR